MELKGSTAHYFTPFSHFLFHILYMRMPCMYNYFLRNTCGHGFNTWASVVWLSSWRILGSPTCIFLAWRLRHHKAHFCLSAAPVSLRREQQHFRFSSFVFLLCCSPPPSLHWSAFFIEQAPPSARILSSSGEGNHIHVQIHMWFFILSQLLLLGFARCFKNANIEMWIYHN